MPADFGGGTFSMSLMSRLFWTLVLLQEHDRRLPIRHPVALGDFSKSPPMIKR
jgi:HAMP domain-containing protein